VSDFYCTVCSKEKSKAPGLVPAINRYDSERIQSISQLAEKAGRGFLILSGEYGLIDAQQPIPWYDHLLVAKEVKVMAQKVAAQLKGLNVQHLTFYGIDEKLDISWQPYWEVIRQSTKSAGIELTTRLI
jgi:hypothetical protein